VGVTPRPRKIVYVTTDLRVGGAEAMLTRLATARPGVADDITIVSLLPAEAYLERLRGAGVTVVELDFGRAGGIVPGLLRLAKLIADRRPDIVQGWMYHGDLAALVALAMSGRRRQTRLVWSIRCSDVDLRRYGVGLRLGVKACTLLSRWPDLITANSAAGLKSHLSLGYRPRRAEIVVNGIDVDEFRPDACARTAVRRELGIADDVTVLAHVARVDPMKDHASFLAAMAELPELLALLVGAGTEHLPEARNVVRLGRRHDVARLFAAADFVVSSSRFGEGFSNVLAEGMACGLPAVATDVGDAKLIVGDTGLVVPRDDPHALAAALRTLAREPRAARLERGARARAHIVERFAMSQAINRCAELYESLQDSQSDQHNLDPAIVRDFGREWRRFDQAPLSHAEMVRMFGEYFSVFPWDSLPPDAVGFDAGCGSGRWAALVAPRVGHLHCVDASADALTVAQKNLAGLRNVSFYQAPLDAMPLPDGSMDFGYSLGVLHHLPDPGAGLAACVQKLKPGAPMLVYVYYAFDHRPAWFRLLWRASDLLRRGVSKAPFRLKSAMTELLAAFVYWPLARAARLFERLGHDVANWPLSAYRWRSYYSMRTDALDRFGTRLEHRMTRDQIKAMMERAGLSDICFFESVQFWCAVGRKV